MSIFILRKLEESSTFVQFVRITSDEFDYLKAIELMEMKTALQYSAIKIRLQWMFFTAFALLVVCAYGFNPRDSYLMLPVASVVAAAVQWYFVLRHYLNEFARWIYFTSLGCIAFFTSLGISILIQLFVNLSFLNSFLKEVVTQTFWLIAVGFFIGGAQWVVLRYRVRNASWWIVVNVAAYALGVEVLQIFQRFALIEHPDLTTVYNIPLLIAGIYIASVLIASITAIPMAILLKSDNIIENPTHWLTQ